MSKKSAESYQQWRRRVLTDNFASLRDEYSEIKDIDPAPAQCNAFHANMALNRYGNVPLIDETRVILNDGLVGDYIHASRVDGYKKNGFILTQAPLGKSPTDYWRMVWQERIQVCVCLTALHEDNVEKSVQFFPISTERPFRAGPFRVFLVDAEETKHPSRMVVCRFRLYCWFAPNNRRERFVFFIIYGEWPDRAVPKDPVTFLTFIDGVKNLQMNAWRRWRAQIDFGKGAAELPPLLINCSAGIGRSATFAASIIEVDRLRDTKQVDLTTTVRKLRRQRAGSVQNIMQYLFIARILAEVWGRMMDNDDETTKVVLQGRSMATVRQ